MLSSMADHPYLICLMLAKPGRTGERVGEKKKIAAIEEGKNVPVLMVFFAHSFNDSLSILRVEEWVCRGS